MKTIEERWELNKKAMEGKNIKFSKYPSTVGEAFKELTNEPLPPREPPVSIEMWEAFNKAAMESVEQVKGHKVRFSKKNRK